MTCQVENQPAPSGSEDAPSGPAFLVALGSFCQNVVLPSESSLELMRAAGIELLVHCVCRGAWMFAAKVESSFLSRAVIFSFDLRATCAAGQMRASSAKQLDIGKSASKIVGDHGILRIREKPNERY